MGKRMKVYPVDISSVRISMKKAVSASGQLLGYILDDRIVILPYEGSPTAKEMASFIEYCYKKNLSSVTYTEIEALLRLAGKKGDTNGS